MESLGGVKGVVGRRGRVLDSSVLLFERYTAEMYLESCDEEEGLAMFSWCSANGLIHIIHCI